MTQEELINVFKHIVKKCDTLINNSNYEADDYTQDTVEDIAELCNHILDGDYGELVEVEEMQEELVSKVWHDASEKPKEENKPIAIKLHSCEVWSPYIVEEMSQGWDVFKENVDIKEWAYVDDILKL